MAESKFLRYQDKNGDGLIDVCEIVEPIPEPLNCEDCKPNPKAIVPEWKKKTDADPWLNGQNCKYQVAVVTKHDSIIGSIDSTEAEAVALVDSYFEEYKEDAVKSLILNFNKKDTQLSRDTLKTSIENEKYDLDIRAGARVRLLYSLPYDALQALPEEDNVELSENEKPEEKEETSIIPGPAPTVRYIADSLESRLKRIRKSLKLYNNYYQIYRAVERTNLVISDTGKVFDLDPYGGVALSEIMPGLATFIERQGFHIGGSPSSNKKVDTIEISFDTKYKINNIKIEIVGCRHKPVNFGPKKLKYLNKREAFRNPTAMAYLAQSEDMEKALMARSPMPWVEYVQKFTYPAVTPVIKYMNHTPAAATATASQEEEGSCVQNAMNKVGQELGQALLDAKITLLDVLEYQFHRQLCMTDEERANYQRDLGFIWSEAPDIEPSGGAVSALGLDAPARKAILAFAEQQAYETIAQSQDPFATLCTRFAIGFSAENKQALDQIFAEGFDRIKLCGMMDFLLDAIGCLLDGLTLEQAFGSMLRAAFSNMSIKDFGKIFKGLPEKKQKEIAALAQKKLETGDVFKDTGLNQQLSDVISSTSARALQPPWEDLEVVEQQEHNKIGGPYEGMTPAQKQSASPPEVYRRTLASYIDPRSEIGKLDTANSVMQAYIAALLEVYLDNYFELIDRLNDLPGAEIVKRILAAHDCPAPPLFDPSVIDFIKDVELPMCWNNYEFTLPRLNNPFGWIPDFKDWTGALMEAARQALQKVIISLIMKLMIKICEIISGAACQALATTKDLAIGKATSDQAFLDIVKDSLCGDAGSQEQAEQSAVDLAGANGVGKGAWDDPEKTLAFLGDMSATMTRKEMMGAFLGEPTPEATEIIDQIIEYEYPEYRDSLPNKQGIDGFFKNVGNLFPLSVRDEMKKFIADLPLDDQMPANPTLCATPEKIEEFCNLRTELLQGRALPSQAREMCDNTPLLDDLDSLADILQGGIPKYLDDNMPPIVSDPGCENGIFPFEPEEAVKVTAQALSGDLDQLKIAYAEDMLGDGPIESSWGMINLILSDTQGNPLTAHHRKANLPMGGYSDYVTDSTDSDFSLLKIIKNPMLLPLLFMKPMPTPFQKGEYPTGVADWLQTQLESVSTNTIYSSTNDFQGSQVYTDSFKDLGFDSLFFGGVDLTALPSDGYNVATEVDYENKEVKFVEEPRKKTPDVTLSFRDNNKGVEGKTGEVWEPLGSLGPEVPVTGPTWASGFDLEMYISDLMESGDKIVNRPGDNVRVVINTAINEAQLAANPATSLLGADTSMDEAADEDDGISFSKWLGPLGSFVGAVAGEEVSYEQQYEFLTTDNAFEGIDMNQYPHFMRAFSEEQPYSPPLLLLQEIIEQNGGSANASSLKSIHDAAMTQIVNNLSLMISANQEAYNYGAALDDLQSSDFDYLIGEDIPGYPRGTEYWKVKVQGNIGGINFERRIRNKDHILGISRNQYNNEDVYGTPEKTRIFYLDPNQFGGSYKSPPIYVSPLGTKGWLGFMDVIFPEPSECKPKKTDLVDFADIKDKMEDRYSKIPEDSRLRLDRDCVIEVPYNKILERPAKAGMEGLLYAAIRIYAATHMIKSMATFTTISPSFPNNYSSLYAQYIIEAMEESFKDPSKPGILPVLFKDTEFWYKFLEQTVQLYGRRVDEGDIVDPPIDVLEALFRLNDMQATYSMRNKRNLKDAKELGDQPFFATLNSYQTETTLEAVRASEEDAKLVLKELVNEQINAIGNTLIENLKIMEIEPLYENFQYYLLNEFANDSSLTLGKKLKEVVDAGLGAPGDEKLYTSGNQFAVSEIQDENSTFKQGDVYYGYYHVYKNEEGKTMYMAGEHHSEALHDVLVPFVNNVTVEIGDVSEYGSSTSTSLPFNLQKYISIDGVKKNPTSAVSQIRSHDHGLNLSEVYPGTLKQVLNDEKEVVGLEGNLGVRYGLELSLNVNGASKTLVSAEVDALDVTIGEFKTIEGDSKLLLCLINNLIDDDTYRLINHYIFSTTKMTAMLAIYNDLAFFQSIGEVTVDYGDSDGPSSTFDSKPGIKYKTEIKKETDLNGNEVDVISVEQFQKEGWASLKDRSPGFFGGLFVTEWDSWDQVILRNSKEKIKNLFDTYYDANNYKPGDSLLPFDPTDMFKRTKRDLYKPPPGKNLLSWRKKRKLRANPFSAAGQQCSKKNK